jgi:tRNA A37 threonylcarbamoyladenosine dehydratase
MLGDEAMESLAGSFVVIAGLGAVGGYAVEALARAGVGRLRLVDFDVVCPTNINRQIFALQSTVGKKKTEIAAGRVKDINPFCRVETLDCFIHSDTIDKVLADGPDLVIDAIDALAPKVELICALKERNISGISSMGAALRDDPTLIRYGILSKVNYCPLAAAIRKRLRRREVPLDVRCVYSVQPPIRQAQAPPASTEDNVLHGGRRGRPRNTLGSLPTITAIFGLTIANEAIKILVNRGRKKAGEASIN